MLDPLGPGGRPRLKELAFYLGAVAADLGVDVLACVRHVLAEECGGDEVKVVARLSFESLAEWLLRVEQPLLLALLFTQKTRVQR